MLIKFALKYSLNNYIGTILELFGTDGVRGKAGKKVSAVNAMPCDWQWRLGYILNNLPKPIKF